MLKGCVIGLGYMGRHHLRNLARISSEGIGIELVGASDIDPNKAAIAEEYGVKFYSDYAEMIDRVEPDFVSIVVPTELHKDIAVDIASRGIDFIIEKPLADSLESAYEIYTAVKEAKVKAMVGHIERFNPVIIALRRLIGEGLLGDIISVSTMRVGLPRLVNIDVVDDLAIHDIDLIRYLTGSSVDKVFGAGYKKLEYGVGRDHADIILLMKNGVLGRVTVGRLSPIKIRRLEMLCSEKYVEADLIKQSAYMYKGILNKKYMGSWRDFIEFLRIFRTEKQAIDIVREEPLYLELKAFINYLLRGGQPPVPIEDAIEVLRIVKSIKYLY